MGSLGNLAQKRNDTSTIQFQAFLSFSLDRTSWKMSRLDHFAWCALHT